MAEIAEEFSIEGEFQQRIPRGGARQPDIVPAVEEDGVHLPRPDARRRRSGSAPGTQQIAVQVEFQHAGGLGFPSRSVTRAVQHPDMVVLIDGHAGDRPHGPIVGQRLRPAGIEFVDFRYVREVRRGTPCACAAFSVPQNTNAEAAATVRQYPRMMLTSLCSRLSRLACPFAGRLLVAVSTPRLQGSNRNLVRTHKFLLYSLRVHRAATKTQRENPA